MTQVAEKGFELFDYADPEEFRFIYEARLRDNQEIKALIRVIDQSLYVPYDLRKRSYNAHLAFKDLFPRLDPGTLKNFRHLDLDLLYIAYRNYFGGSLNAARTGIFLQNEIYAEENVNELIAEMIDKIKNLLYMDLPYTKWFDIAYQWARIRMMVDGGFSRKDITGLAKEIDSVFQHWMIENYKYLSASVSSQSPVMAHKVADFIRARSQKAALILVDGMSVENWLTWLANAWPFHYDVELGFSFVLVPTITPVSRQTVFTGKLPVSLPKPFSLSNEEKQWREFWKMVGYNDSEIFFGRGYDIEIPFRAGISGIVINTIDDIMHGQIQGQEGMYRDIRSWAQKRELQSLIDKLMKKGFDVFITSDHGNVQAVGQGKPANEGLLTEMTGLRARVYQDFALTQKIKEDFQVINYPGTYLPKEYQYIISEGRNAFAPKGKGVMCHGGMNIEEVIVPFIKVKEVKQT